MIPFLKRLRLPLILEIRNRVSLFRRFVASMIAQLLAKMSMFVPFMSSLEEPAKAIQIPDMLGMTLLICHFRLRRNNGSSNGLIFSLADFEPCQVVVESGADRITTPPLY